LVGHQTDCRAARALPGLVHEQLQFLLALFVICTLRNKLFAGIVLIFSGISEEPSHERICSDAHPAKSAEKINATNGRIRMMGGGHVKWALAKLKWVSEA